MIYNKTKVLTFVNHFHNVGKTTSALNIAYQFGKKGYKCLIIDLDPQGNIGLSFGYDTYTTELNEKGEEVYAYNLIEGLIEKRLNPKEKTPYTFEEIKDYIYTPKFKSRRRIDGNKWGDVIIPFGFDITLNTSDLSIIDLKMALNSQGKINPFFISDIVECIKNEMIYDYIIIDTPPAIGSLSVNAIVAAKDGIIIPSTFDHRAFKCVKGLISSINEIVEVYEQGNMLRGILGIVLTGSEKWHDDIKMNKYILEYYPIPVFKTSIRESSDARKASASGYLFSQLNDKADADFFNLAIEIELAINNKEKWEKRATKFYNKVAL